MKKESLTLPETNPGKAKFLAETQRINLNAEPTGRAALVAPQLIDLRGAFHALQIEASPVNSPRIGRPPLNKIRAMTKSESTSDAGQEKTRRV
jgi:hypothetical protein